MLLFRERSETLLFTEKRERSASEREDVFVSHNSSSVLASVVRLFFLVYLFNCVLILITVV